MGWGFALCFLGSYGIVVLYAIKECELKDCSAGDVNGVWCAVDFILIMQYHDHAYPIITTGQVDQCRLSLGSLVCGPQKNTIIYYR